MTIGSDLEDLVFWATAFWQEPKQKENKKDPIEYHLPYEGAAAIAESLNAMGYEEVTPADILVVYMRRA